MFEAFFLAQRIFVGGKLSLSQKKILVAHALMGSEVMAMVNASKADKF